MKTKVFNGITLLRMNLRWIKDLTFDIKFSLCTFIFQYTSKRASPLNTPRPLGQSVTPSIV